jgi:hypothetical protein
MEPSTSGGAALVKRLGEEEVMQGVVAQLGKDLGAPGAITAVAPDAGAFEALRAQVLPILEEKHQRSVHELQVAMYRVDLGERVTREAMRLGGLNELAGRVVLRALQKVLTRLTLR